ncbi:MAG TPA: methyltransferase domain-containing protein [Polyangia bacterium]
MSTLFAPLDQANAQAGGPTSVPMTGSTSLLEGFEFTRDSLMRGRVTLYQPRQGFRSSVDPVLLAGFLTPPYGRLLDIGCGTGALAFQLCAQDPAATGVGVELQPRLGQLLALGVAHNGLADRFRIEVGDIRTVQLPAASFDLVATNPPFQALGQGVLPADRERAIAHHEVELRLEEWIARAASLCRPGGRVGVVFPASRSTELLARLEAEGLIPQRLRPVYPRAGQPATRVLVEARRLPQARLRPLVFEPPLHVYVGEVYSDEVRGFFGDDAAPTKANPGDEAGT